MRPESRPGGRIFPLLLLCACLASAGSGCAFIKKHLPRKHGRSAPAARKAARRSAHQPKKIDHKAQQRAYDRGVRYFSEEKYLKARKAWKESLLLGPETRIGRKTRGNLREVEQILETLQELEGQ